MRETAAQAGRQAEADRTRETAAKAGRQAEARPRQVRLRHGPPQDWPGRPHAAPAHEREVDCVHEKNVQMG